MLFGEGLVGLVVLAFWLWAIFDVISTDESLCRNLPKGMWIMIVLFLADIGALAWLLLGRPENAGFAPGDTRPRAPTRRVAGPEDSPGWDARLDARTGIAETPRERQLREMREHYAALDAELDRRLEQKRSLGDQPPLDPA
jgi:hypothetical protein